MGTFDSSKKPDIYETVHAALDARPELARVALESLLDLHHEHKGGCVECSRKFAVTNWPAGAVKFPCPTVSKILEVTGSDART